MSSRRLMAVLRACGPLDAVERRVWVRWFPRWTSREVLQFKWRHGTRVFGLVPGGRADG